MWPHVKFSRRTGRNSSSRNCSWLLTYFKMWKLIKLLGLYPMDRCHQIHPQWT